MAEIKRLPTPSAAEDVKLAKFIYCQWKCKLEQTPCNATWNLLVELDKGRVYDPILHFHSSYTPEKGKCIPCVPKDMSGHNVRNIIHNNPKGQATQMSQKWNTWVHVGISMLYTMLHKNANE